MPKSAIDLLTGGAPWAIMPEMLETIEAIANRETSPEAVAKELGRPLHNTRSVELRGDVAVIPVSGPIFPKANLMTEISGATSIQMLALDFNQALNNPNVKSIVLDMSSPGGQVSGINEFAGMVKAAGKHVTAYIGDLAASACYWIASQASEIVIEPTGLAGNIGVVLGYRLSEKDDPNKELVSSRAPDKRPDLNTEHGLSVLQSRIDSIEDVFLTTVASGRGMSVDDVAAIRGQVLVGQAAVDAGLADKLGSLESVIAGLSGVSTNGGAMPDVKKVSAGEHETPALTVSALQSDHPEIYQAVFDAGVASVDVSAAKKEGAEDERERIKAVQEQSVPGHEALIAELAFDGKSTAGEAAIAGLKAEKEAKTSHLTTAQSRPEPLPDASVDEHSTGNSKELAQQAKAMVAEHKAKGITLSLTQAMNKIKHGEIE